MYAWIIDDAKMLTTFRLGVVWFLHVFLQQTSDLKRSNKTNWINKSINMRNSVGNALSFSLDSRENGESEPA